MKAKPKLSKLISEAVGAAAEHQRELVEIVRAIQAMPPSHERAALAKRAVNELGLAPEIFGLRRPRSDPREGWTAERWALERASTKAAAKDFREAGRLDKAGQLENEARHALEMERALRAARRRSS